MYTEGATWRPQMIQHDGKRVETTSRTMLPTIDIYIYLYALILVFSVVVVEGLA